MHDDIHPQVQRYDIYDEIDMYVEYASLAQSGEITFLPVFR